MILRFFSKEFLSNFSLSYVNFSGKIATCELLIRDIAKLVQKSTCGQTHPFEPKKEEKPEVHHCNRMIKITEKHMVIEVIFDTKMDVSPCSDILSSFEKDTCNSHLKYISSEIAEMFELEDRIPHQEQTLTVFPM